MAETANSKNELPIQSVAATSEALSASLLKFAAKWDSGQHFINNIAVTASGIGSLLQDAAKTIEKYPEEAGLYNNAINTQCKLIRADLEILKKALEKADLKAGPGRFVARNTTRFTPRRGGELEPVPNTDWNAGTGDQGYLNKCPDGEDLLRGELMSDTWAPDNLEVARYHLWYLFEGFRYLALRKVEKE
jgi:hypothetical protein